MPVAAVPRSLPLLGYLLIGVAPLAAQAALSGVVREDGTKRLLAGVEILVEGSERIAVSDAAGHYEFKSAPTGTQIVLFRSVGFRPVRIRADLGKGGVTQLDANLVPFAVRLDPLVATGEMKQPRGMGREAFEERRRMGFGQYIDSLELRRSENRRLSDLLRGRHGIGLAQNRYVTSTRSGCLMQIVYDDQALFSPAAYAPPPPPTATGIFSRLQRQPRPISQPTGFDINTFEVANLEAVEVYQSYADTPIQYGGAGAGCGTVVLWSRRGGWPKP